MDEFWRVGVTWACLKNLKEAGKGERIFSVKTQQMYQSEAEENL